VAKPDALLRSRPSSIPIVAKLPSFEELPKTDLQGSCKNEEHRKPP
jgi:hypothetical protein